jgi:hypothetical protein
MICRLEPTKMTFKEYIQESLLSTVSSEHHFAVSRAHKALLNHGFEKNSQDDHVIEYRKHDGNYEHRVRIGGKTGNFGHISVSDKHDPKNKYFGSVSDAPNYIETMHGS